MPTSMTVTNAGKNLRRDALIGANVAIINYVALGSGTTAPSVSDTQLVTETFRKTVTSFTNGASAGEVIVSVYLGPNDAVNFDLEEVGVFCGASAAPNSGTLIARGLYAHSPKSNLESITLSFDIQL